jgi:starch phosphorylase
MSVHTATTAHTVHLPAAPLPSVKPEVAYFCAEFGLSEGLPFFAGGLGILAGDVVKQADEEQFPLVGVGLFYHGKRDRQIVYENGAQEYKDYPFDPAALGFSEVRTESGESWKCTIPLDNEEVHVYALAKVLPNGNIVYFLETDRVDNPWHLRDLTLAPYWGDERQQLRQQLVLGCAGVRLLSDLDLLPQTFHLNEGRPAVLAWELAALFHEKVGLPAFDALQQVRQKLVYTNHTLVRAGNLAYDAELVKQHVRPWADRLGLPGVLLLEPGLSADGERFEITEFGLQMSRVASGVSERHTRLCEEQWPEFSWVNITNGVHFRTWQKSSLSNPALSDHDLWTAHIQAKYDLMEEAIARTGIGYDPNQLVLGWARRVTDYKRLGSVFADIQRLRAILDSSTCPTQIVVAGKAHPGDFESQELLQVVIQLFQTELSGRALFIPNYDIGLSKHLVAGVDVWLNTPVDGREACGTSGMKAASNGVLQATVADGWAAELDWGGIGWTLNPEQPGLHLLDLLEQEIQPLYMNRHNTLPTGWIERMRRTQDIAQRYSASRMLREYQEKLYS